eukprot:CFRG8469T1
MIQFNEEMRASTLGRGAWAGRMAYYGLFPCLGFVTPCQSFPPTHRLNAHTNASQLGSQVFFAVMDEFLSTVAPHTSYT